MLPYLSKQHEVMRAADWGFGMSICIALLCESGRKIVLVSDSKVNFGGYSAELAIKTTPFGKYSAVLTAGDDVEYAKPILERGWDILLEKYKSEVVDTVRLADAIDEAYAEEISRIVETRVLRKRGFNAKTFVEKGRGKCTPSAYLTLCNRIDQVNVNLQFLVCGIDEYDEAHLLVVDGQDAPKDHTSVGMWAIGSGAYAAMSWLAFHADQNHFNRYGGVETAVYFAVTAKFMAETEGQVGKRKTFTVILENKGSGYYVTDENILVVRKLWEKYGSPPVPKGLKEKMKPTISSFKGMEKSDSEKSKDSQEPSR